MTGGHVRALRAWEVSAGAHARTPFSPSALSLRSRLLNRHHEPLYFLSPSETQILRSLHTAFCPDIGREPHACMQRSMRLGAPTLHTVMLQRVRRKGWFAGACQAPHLSCTPASAPHIIRSASSASAWGQAKHTSEQQCFLAIYGMLCGSLSSARYSYHAEHG